MNKKRLLTILAVVALFAIVTAGVVSADDGVMLRRNISKTPDAESGEAGMDMMGFYVPAQSSSGELTTVLYQYDTTDDDGNPLVGDIEYLLLVNIGLPVENNLVESLVVDHRVIHCKNKFDFHCSSALLKYFIFS